MCALATAVFTVPASLLTHVVHLQCKQMCPFPEFPESDPERYPAAQLEALLFSSPIEALKSRGVGGLEGPLDR